MSFLVDRAFARLDEFRWGQLKRRSLLQPQQNRVISYQNPENSRERRAIPLFGVEAGAFGLDWAGDAPVHYRGGTVPRPILHNVDGHIPEDAKPLLEPSEPYVDPNISPRAARASESTDQRFVGIGHDTSPIDKPITLNHQIRKSLESDTGKNPRTPTQSDKAAADEKAWDFDFRG